MKILFLDDDDNRHSAFVRGLIGFGHDIDHTFTHDHCLEYLKANTYDVIFLDHDLNFEKYSSVRKDEKTGKVTELTGAHVAKVVAELPDEKLPKFVVVHSWNPDGANNMLNILTIRGIKTVRWVFAPQIPHQLLQMLK